MGISLGVVGVGSFGSAFANLFMAHPAVDRIALCDREPGRTEKFADTDLWRESGKLNPSDLYDSFDAILDTDLDALAIITQPWLHAPQALRAMESGKSVYSAVPIISIPDDDEILDWCDRIVNTSRRTGMRYMLGETTFYRAQAMYCRRRAAEGAFGDFVYAEGEYLHDVDSACNLREVAKHRKVGQSGAEFEAIMNPYRERGLKSGPMHYPTHSTSGPISVMGAHASKVSCSGWANRTDDDFFASSAFSNELAFYQMSNGATMRIAECREIGHPGREIFRVYGTRGSFERDQWCTNLTTDELSIEQMRDPLPVEVDAAFRSVSGDSDAYGGHGGSHAYLVHEFVDAIATGRQPAINAWEASRYMAAGVVAHQSALRDGEWLDVPDWGDAPA
jgi:predicted dehydrogenase